MTLDQAGLLAAYNDQLRAHVPARLPAGVSVERDGPVLRLIGMGDRGVVLYRDLGGLRGAALDALIARQRAFFAGRGEAVEWKYHSHDQPAELAERLVAAGFVPEERETVVIGPVTGVADDQMLPEGATLQEVTERVDLERIVGLHDAVWGGDNAWIATELAAERAADPKAITIVVIEVAGETVCAAWVRFHAGTEFATLWGGSTLPAWRRRGLYRATVAYRARLAADRGVRYLQVDASDDSRPILERLGFVAVATTTPYVWSPPPGA
jgi:GNAT superfamily N-acetyltransferase